MRGWARLIPALMALFLAASGCQAAPPPTPGLISVPLPTASPLPADGSDRGAALSLVAAEAEAVRQQDIDALAGLWLPEGVIVDANHTPDDPLDDRSWEGWPAIQERYVSEVFPFVADPVTVPRPRVDVPSVEVYGDQAEVAVPGPDGRTTQDEWLLRRQEGHWRLARLAFNLAPGQ